jgi:15-cis-phytoene synthase
MSEPVQEAPLASFEAKWSQTHPELALALTFVGADERAAQSAFACLVCELEQAAFGIREAQPAAIKLQWWGEEFARAGKREARHPLTRILQLQPGFAATPIAHWYEVIAGALAQRDPEPAADRAAQLGTYFALYRPLGLIEATVFPADPRRSVLGPASDRAESLAHVRARSRALRETASLADALRDGRLPLPLDLLARHRLARGDLARASPQQAAALREWLRALASDHAGGSGTGLGVLLAAGASADRWRALHAAKAGEPLSALQEAITRLPMRATWAAWRAARR